MLSLSSCHGFATFLGSVTVCVVFIVAVTSSENETSSSSIPTTSEQWDGLNFEEHFNISQQPAPPEGQQMIIFDLDHTMFPIDFGSEEFYNLTRQENYTLKPFPEVIKVLDWLKRMGYTVAVIARTKYGSQLLVLLHKYEMTQYFKFMEIGDEPKLELINSIQYRSGVEFSEMLYFEHDSDIIVELLTKKVTPFDVTKRGLTMGNVRKGLVMFDWRPHKPTTAEYSLEEHYDYEFIKNYPPETPQTQGPRRKRKPTPTRVQKEI